MKLHQSIIIIIYIINRFIVNNINEQIVTQFLKNLEVLSTVDNVEERMVQYLIQHGHKYFDNSIIIIN